MQNWENIYIFFYYLLGLREFVRTTQIDWTLHNFLLKSFNSPQWLLVCEGIYKVFSLKSKTLFLQLLFHFAFQGIVPLSWLHCPVVGLSLISKNIWWLNSSVPHAHHLPAPQGTGLLSSTYWVLLSGKQLECVASPLLVFQFWNWNINYDWNIKLFTYLTFPFLNFSAP